MLEARILIADDDAMTRLDLRRMIEDLGYSVVGEADNGEDACRLARSLRPDLTILDIMMPQMSGLDAAATISRERLGAVVLLTAYSDAHMIEQANRAGVLAYLVKPFRQQEVQPAIDIAIARYRELVALEGALEAAQEQAETNRLIGRAKRVLMYWHGLSDQEAFRRLQAQALATKRTLREIAEAILLADEMTIAGDGGPAKPRTGHRKGV
ncbi:MAG: response regulator [Chloroherpetonaceae bacterium]|nr:response regulator [Chthonomonadaceae bacterium]MDW8207723.1 response regulator [Chloroherpetonaceae bacterium]